MNAHRSRYSELFQDLGLTPKSENLPDRIFISPADREDDTVKAGDMESLTDQPEFVTGKLQTATGIVPIISTDLSRSDKWGVVKCRTTSFRNTYMVAPGIYAVGAPGRDSEVLVSANYKFSFDMLRRELSGLDAWILVLDTKGINVWCAAGKGTFGTAELAKRVAGVGLGKIVEHRRLVVPQLGAVGVCARDVRRLTGFRVIFGPVLARDVPDFLQAGRRATDSMRKIEFGLKDRLVLTPMEIVPALRRYPLFALLILVAFGLQPQGVLFEDAISAGLPFLLLGLAAVAAGGLMTPLLLPWIPSRSFALKGFIAGTFSLAFLLALPPMHLLLTLSAVLFFPVASSYIALQFTGSTTFTGVSGVKRELRVALPLYALALTASVFLLFLYKIWVDWSLR